MSRALGHPASYLSDLIPVQRPSHLGCHGRWTLLLEMIILASYATAVPTGSPRALDSTGSHAQFCSPTASPVAWVCSARLLRSLRQRPSVKFHSVVDFALSFAFLLDCEVFLLASSYLYIITSTYLQLAPNISKTPKKNQSESNWHKHLKTMK